MRHLSAFDLSPPGAYGIFASPSAGTGLIFINEKSNEQAEGAALIFINGKSNHARR